MATPSFKTMWKQFPDHTIYPTLRDLHTFIGGALANNIDVPGFGTNGNTCAVRMSRALNYGSLPISAKLVKALKVSTLTGTDGKLYIFRVRELRIYLNSSLGVTPTKITKNFATAFTKKQGIVAFDVSGWGDASGHVALWDGSAFREAQDDYRGLKDNPKTAKVEPNTTAMSIWEI